jgi:beta-lactamase class A
MKKYIIPTTLLLCAIVLVIASFFGGMWYSDFRANTQLSSHNLLSKRIFLSRPNDILVNFEPMRAELREELAYYNDRVSLYFEYLPTGTSVRLGDATQLVAASLLKVPVSMELYRLSEMDRVNLDQKVTLKQEWVFKKHFI